MSQDRAYFKWSTNIGLIFFAVLIGLFIAVNQNGKDSTHDESDHLHEGSSLANAGSKDVEMHPDIFRTPVDKEGGGQPLVSLGPNSWIEGQISFAEGSVYPNALSSIKIVAVSNGFPKDLEESIGTYQEPFLLFPVQLDGTFRIPVTREGQAVTLGAVGPFCVAEADVIATHGQGVAQISMHFVYGLDTSLAEAGGEALVASNVEWLKKYNTFVVVEDCIWGVKSHLSSEYFFDGQPLLGSESGRISRHVVTMSSFLEEGVGLRFSANQPGYKSEKGKLFIPPADGLIQYHPIELNRSDEEWSSIELTVARSGDWEAFSGYDYHSQGSFLIRNGSEGRFVIKQRQCDLSPGTRSLTGIPLDDPETFLLLCSNLNLDNSRFEGGFWELDLEQSPIDSRRYSTTVDSSQIGAIAVPPAIPNETGQAWFGVRLHGQTQITNRRYEAGKGLLFDGLVPGVYDVFWSNDGQGNGREFRSMTASNTPLVELTVQPGINLLLLP